jgi:hypothetical protein
MHIQSALSANRHDGGKQLMIFFERLLIGLLNNQLQSMKAIADLEFDKVAQCPRSFKEMTLSDLATDELIARLNEADGIRQQSFEQLLQSAARVLTGKRL